MYRLSYTSLSDILFPTGHVKSRLKMNYISCSRCVLLVWCTTVLHM